MFDRIAGRYDLMNRMLTLGLDQRWRRATIGEAMIGPGMRVLDLASGTGDFCELLTERGAYPVGSDLSGGMLRVARERLPGCALVEADAEALPHPDSSFDALTCGFALRNFVSIEPILREAARVLERGAPLALLDVSEPENALVARGHALWFRRVVPRVGGMISDKEAYSYLPASTAYLPAPDVLATMITDAGFTNVRRRTFSGGIVQLFVATRDDRS